MSGFIHTDNNSRSSLFFNQSPSFNAETLELHSETRKFAASPTLPSGTRILDGYLTNAPADIDGSDKTKKAIFEINPSGTGEDGTYHISYKGYNDGCRGTQSEGGPCGCSKRHKGLESAKALITSGYTPWMTGGSSPQCNAEPAYWIDKTSIVSLTCGDETAKNYDATGDYGDASLCEYEEDDDTDDDTDDSTDDSTGEPIKAEIPMALKIGVPAVLGLVVIMAMKK